MRRHCRPSADAWLARTVRGGLGTAWMSLACDIHPACWFQTCDVHEGLLDGHCICCFRIFHGTYARVLITHQSFGADSHAVIARGGDAAFA